MPSSPFSAWCNCTKSWVDRSRDKATQVSAAAIRSLTRTKTSRKKCSCRLNSMTCEYTNIKTERVVVESTTSKEALVRSQTTPWWWRRHRAVLPKSSSSSCQRVKVTRIHSRHVIKWLLNKFHNQRVHSGRRQSKSLCFLMKNQTIKCLEVASNRCIRTTEITLKQLPPHLVQDKAVWAAIRDQVHVVNIMVIRLPPLIFLL